MSIDFKSTELQRGLLRGSLMFFCIMVYTACAAVAQSSIDSDTLLRISGQIVSPEGQDFVDLDRSELEALPQVTFETTTIWTDTAINFSGPALGDVLASVGAGQERVLLFAENGYNIEFPREHLESAAPIIATRINGAPFSLREKGPLWLVFPYDSDPVYRTETIYAYSIWQLTSIEVID